MGFWDKVGKMMKNVIEYTPVILQTLQVESQKKRIELHDRGLRQIKQYERKLNQAIDTEKLKDPEYARKVEEAKRKLDQAKLKLQSYTFGYGTTKLELNSQGKILFGGKTLQEWERNWVYIGIWGSLTLDDLRPYNKSVGVYKAEIGGEIKYIGRAIELYNGGFRKRIRDYTRDSDSARKHQSGKNMHEYADKIRISFLVIGDDREDIGLTMAIEEALIQKYKPEWNVQNKRF